MTKKQTTKSRKTSDFDLSRIAQKKYRFRRIVFDTILLGILALIDQVIKIICLSFLSQEDTFVLIPDFLGIRVISNTGGPFGLLQDQTFLFIFLAFVILIGMYYILIRMPAKSRFLPLHIGISVLLGGVLSNMIDRLRLFYVIDYIDILPVNFPAFNLADVYVTLSVLFLIILFLFFYKEQDLYFLDIKEKKLRDLPSSKKDS